MYSKEENIRFKKDFWTKFGQYMKPVPNSEGLTINWVNYKTGIRFLNFRMDVDRNHAQIAIEISKNKTEDRLAIFQQFYSLKTLFAEIMQEDWEWIENKKEEHHNDISIISKKLPNVNINLQEDWPTIIGFLKERIMKLDAFWNDCKMAFEEFKY